MRWATALSCEHDLETALNEAAAEIRRGLEGASCDLAVVFVSHHHLFHYGKVTPLLQDALRPGTLVGCSAGAVIGGGRECEDGPGVAVTAAHLPGVHRRLVHLEDDLLPPLDGSPRAWVEAVGVEPTEQPAFVILSDPFSSDVDSLLQGLDFAYPGAPKVGGLASGANAPGGNALFAHDRTLPRGSVLLVLSGDLRVDTLVAQGCRPVGPVLHVSDCEGHMVHGLDGRPPLDVLQEIYERADEQERRLLRNALFLGLATDELKADPGAGEFLIRNVMGINPDRGVMAVAAHLRRGQTVQFHVRDRRSAAEDLQAHLAALPEHGRFRGALLFSCLGRGKHLYGEPDHDSRLFAQRVGPVPLAGFFCNGEIGPVGGSSHVHGYTSAFGLFGPRD